MNIFERIFAWFRGLFTEPEAPVSAPKTEAGVADGPKSPSEDEGQSEELSLTAEEMAEIAAVDENAIQESDEEKPSDINLAPYWDQLKAQIQAKKVCQDFEHIAAGNRSVLGRTVGGLSGVSYNFFFGSEARVEVYIDTPSKQNNVFIFQQFKRRKDKIESAMGCALSWDVMSKFRASRISLSLPADKNDTESWGRYIDWQLTQMPILIEAITPHIGPIYTALQRHKNKA